jgi:DNA modification methylase
MVNEKDKRLTENKNNVSRGKHIDSIVKFPDGNENQMYNQNGRFPSQAFVTTETAEILDNMGGGGSSKILHQCDFETADFDLFVYEPKVSASERNAGCEFIEKKKGGIANDSGRSYKTKCSICEKEIRKDNRKNACECEAPQEYYPELSQKNNHPTLKPISLNYQITKLFKTPNVQTVLVPFSGAGSELIGLFKAGFENIKGCELNPEYVEIARARVKHHCEDMFNPDVLETE